MCNSKCLIVWSFVLWLFGIVYIEIEKGNKFGEIDFVLASGSRNFTVEEMVENLNMIDFNMVRQFTV